MTHFHTLLAAMIGVGAYIGMLSGLILALSHIWQSAQLKFHPDQARRFEHIFRAVFWILLAIFNVLLLPA